MCEVKIYRDSKNGELLMEGVARYELNLKDNVLTAETIMGETKRFKLEDIRNVRWSEFNDSLIIEGGIERLQNVC